MFLEDSLYFIYVWLEGFNSKVTQSAANLKSSSLGLSHQRMGDLKLTSSNTLQKNSKILVLTCQKQGIIIIMKRLC
jgi:hypothetical protein